MNCNFCNKEYKGTSAKANIKKHLVHCLLNPNGINYKCSKCGKEFSNKNSHNGHKGKCGVIKLKYKKENKTKTKCEFCDYIDENYYKLGFHISRCKNNPNFIENDKKFRQGWIGKKHSEETKKKISDARIKFLTENPDKVPYLINHSSKESYPEKYFTELFKNENIDVEKDFRIGLYELDFSIPSMKIDIEIDGDQHYLDERIVESDNRRNIFLKENGWTIIRIRWSDYKKLDRLSKEKYIEELKLKLKS